VLSTCDDFDLEFEASLMRLMWEMIMRTAAFIAVSVALVTSAYAASNRLQFWNLTPNTVTEFHLSPTGMNQWGKDQCQNDKDGSVDHDERLPILDTPAGVYDAKLKDKTGRVCIAKGLIINTKGIFSIEETQLSDCRNEQN
jgi:hypothetical protein